jgi:predicted Rossmann fold flavoprotein
MIKPSIVIVGGGAAGFFAAITSAETAPAIKVILLEKGPQFLSKVRISGGGRCNVTHACFDPRELSSYYPRGAQALVGPFSAFQPADTMSWFERRGVALKTEKDGRVFPVTDSSQTIIDCLLKAANGSGVELVTGCAVEHIERRPEGKFEVQLARGTSLHCERVMLATGGCRGPSAGQLAVSLGHRLVPPVPSLFSFHIETAWLRELAGISFERVQASIPCLKLTQLGPLLLTHQGLSGPLILKLSAWGSRALHDLDYHFELNINWVPDMNEAELGKRFERLRVQHAARLVINQSAAQIPVRLWEQLVLSSGTSRDTRWAHLSRSAQHRLIQQLTRTQLPVTGKSLNKDEFVTCGGVPLNEVNFKSMESRVCPGLYFGGELLDIDGLTGGFNFQAAWTTGWLAGRAMAILPG